MGLSGYIISTMKLQGRGLTAEDLYSCLGVCGLMFSGLRVFRISGGCRCWQEYLHETAQARTMGCDHKPLQAGIGYRKKTLRRVVWHRVQSTPVSNAGSKFSIAVQGSALCASAPGFLEIQHSQHGIHAVPRSLQQQPTQRKHSSNRRRPTHLRQQASL